MNSSWVDSTGKGFTQGWGKLSGHVGVLRPGLGGMQVVVLSLQLCACFPSMSSYWL